MEVDEGKMLFKLRKGKGSVHSFMDAAGVRHFPGDVVELPATYLGLTWLEPVEKAVKPVAAPSKVEPAKPVSVPDAPVALVPKKNLKKSISS